MSVALTRSFVTELSEQLGVRFCKPWLQELAKNDTSKGRIIRVRVAEILKGLSDEQAALLTSDSQFWLRDEQLTPTEDWAIWMILAGRGWGKTRCGAGAVIDAARSGLHERIGIVAETARDCRDVIVEGSSGIIASSPVDFVPLYEPSKRRLTWPNGASAILLNGSEEAQLRGPQYSFVWCDELAKFRDAQGIYDAIQFCLRLGKDPKLVITTTPRATPLIKKLISSSANPENRIILTRGSTDSNKENLAPTFMKSIYGAYGGTRLGRQELYAEVLEDVVGALWLPESIDGCRLGELILPEMRRVIVAVDPSGTSGKATVKEGKVRENTSDEIGIVVCGIGEDGRFYVLADRSLNASPAKWGNTVVQVFHEFNADVVIAERNFGGDMVAEIIRAADPNIDVKTVFASRGKIVRASPIAALYEQNRVTHAEIFGKLEGQMMEMTLDGYIGDGSPDRVDALVWGLAYLSDRLITELSGAASAPSVWSERG